MLWESIDRDDQPNLPEPAEMLEPAAVARAVLFAVTQPGEVSVPNLMVQRS
jgi:NADP-dependent 3-hydroxy acid dehydrogenase YdfG